MARLFHSRYPNPRNLLIPVRYFTGFCPPLYGPNMSRLRTSDRLASRRERMFKRAVAAHRLPLVSLAAFLNYSGLSGRR